MLLGWDQAELAAKADLSSGTVKRLEAKPGMIGGTVATALRIKSALEEAGIEFIGTPDEGPGVRLWRK